MYVTVQFIILEILLGLIFLVILYFMVRELLKKIIRKEIREIMEPLQVLANYLVDQSQQEGPDDPDDNDGDGRQSTHSGRPGTGPLPATSPEKLPEEPVDIADEFVQLKNTNRISAYNIRVQKIWDLYKQKKITLHQYKDELLRLKKEFGIETGEQEAASGNEPLKTASGARLKPLTPTPSAAPKEKAKNLKTDPRKDDAGDDGEKDPDKGNKAANLDNVL
ncbi:hypothetical protein [Arachidicoccus terrestris]|uniref:hypothetical protein n=1 Tax=Arachidicoccus terrestris TaxID=2875539 RepID=UPI001CC5DFC5|nr:hypothetical protein [Arachidicoccus terrestris]UAY55097.1 hypothetical protein K9M52_16970 [Arachidicoccus terrestris]